VRLWNQAAGAPLQATSSLNGVTGVALSPADTLLASGGDGTVRLWNAVTGRPAGAPIHASARDGVSAVAFSPDGTLLASGSADGTVRLWTTVNGRPVGAPIHASAQNSVRAVAFSPDSKLLASAAGDGTVRLWNLATRRLIGAPLRVGSGPDHGRLVAVFWPGGALIASCWSASPIVARP
jgi:WD40 repeat protein